MCVSVDRTRCSNTFVTTADFHIHFHRVHTHTHLIYVTLGVTSRSIPNSCLYLIRLCTYTLASLVCLAANMEASPAWALLFKSC